MNTSGLLPWQPDHVVGGLFPPLVRYGSVLDASDTGTGKTVTALAVARELGVVPIVFGPKNSKATWEWGAKLLGVDCEWVNYEKVRGRRQYRGGVEVDTIAIYENRTRDAANPAFLVGYNSGRSVLQKACGWGEAACILVDAGGPNNTGFEYGEWKLPMPTYICKTYTSESEWLEEVKYGKGSFLKFKRNYTMGIFDEAHRCGGSTTLNSKSLIAARRQFKFVMALSATAADDPRQMKALGFALGLHKLSDKKFGFRNWLFDHGGYIEDEDRPGIIEFNTSKRVEVFEKLHAEVFPAHGARMRKSLIPSFPKTQIITKFLFDETGKAKKLADGIRQSYERFKAQARLTDSYIHDRQALELLMVPDIVDLASDLVPQARVAVFVNFTRTLDELVSELSRKFGSRYVGHVDGSQTGVMGTAQREKFCEEFRANRLLFMVCNNNAGKESISLHDPTGQVEHDAIICPCDSGRTLKQVMGRVDRANGHDSIQYMLYFKNTVQEEVANRVIPRVNNIELLNDAAFI